MLRPYREKFLPGSHTEPRYGHYNFTMLGSQSKFVQIDFWRPDSILIETHIFLLPTKYWVQICKNFYPATVLDRYRVIYMLGPQGQFLQIYLGRPGYKSCESHSKWLNSSPRWPKCKNYYPEKCPQQSTLAKKKIWVEKIWVWALNVNYYTKWIVIQ